MNAVPTRVAGLAGAASIGLLLLGDDGIAGEPPDLHASRADVERYLQQHGHVAQWLGHGLAACSVALLLVFYVALADRSRLPTISRLLGAVAAAIAILSYAPTIVVAGDRTLTPHEAKLFFDLAHAMFTVSFLAFGLVTLTYAAGSLPRAVSWTAIVVAAAMIFGALAGPYWEQAYAVIILWFVWVVGGGLWLALHGQRAVHAAGTR
jgi:FtsH-binding integral membrane protein